MLSCQTSSVSAEHAAHCATTVPRVGRSYEHFLGGFSLHLLQVLLKEMQDKLAATAQELASVVADGARVAKRQRRTTAQNAAKSLADQGAQANAHLVQFKQVPHPRSLMLDCVIAPDHTLSP